VSDLRYKTILLKLSGEALKADKSHGFERETIIHLVSQIKDIHALGVRIGLVIGGGNFFRGAQNNADWLPRTNADQIGMMATVMNGVALQSAFEAHGVPATLFSAFAVEGIANRYHYKTAMSKLDEGHVLIFAGGTGHPFFSTDTVGALRAREIGAEVMLKATKVDGVYTADPVADPDAKRYTKMTYMELLEKNLRVMDGTAVSFCREYKIPIVVFDVNLPGQLQQAVLGKDVGTKIAESL
jgi:uridylate kinase